MSKKLRYKGGFHSAANVLYGVEIWQDDYTGTATDMAFCASPLEIEWPEVDKIEPVRSSRATLQLYSDTDRQFVSLYAVKAGSIRLDVYREGVLYWSGTLDPELYEEPFAYKEGYGVAITFSDMALLDRLTWNLRRFMTLRGLVEHLLTLTGIKQTGIVEYISTKLNLYGSENLLDSVSIQTENFYDEEGEAMTAREVLDETLRPFALGLVQKGGKVIVYDLNSLHTTLEPKEIRWEADDAVLSVDKVYNNVKVTFSPYEKTNLLKGEVNADSVQGGQMLTTWTHVTAATSEVGFKTTLSDTGKGLEKHPSARYYKIEPIYSGAEEAGVAWTVQTHRPGADYINYLNAATPTIGSMLLKVPGRAYIADSGYANRQDYKLKVTLQLLFDPRYNPFESAWLENEEGNMDEQNNWANYAYVPFLLTLKNEAGEPLYHWENKGVKDSHSFSRDTHCKWVAGAGTWGDAWLCWYDGERKRESGLGGWAGNKQIIGYYRGSLPASFDKMDKGEYVDLPPVAGWLELQVGTGVPAYDYKDSHNWEIVQGLYNQCRWILYKEPAIDLTNKYGKRIDTKDI